MTSRTLQPTVLVVEDEKSIASVIQYGLQKEGCMVYCCGDGQEAINFVIEHKPDIVLLDWMLPGCSGLEVCKRIRENNETQNIPIVMISARGEEFDVVAGLKNGADDYLVKPFSQAELNARIKAILRRLRPVFSEDVLEFRDIKMDLNKYEVTRGGRPVKLAPIEFQILQILMSEKERVFKRETIIDRIWGVDIYVGARTVDVHITRLRKSLLNASTDKRDVIKTVRLVGYALDTENA
jgi:two-component system phosphate regulon response regulator PhoB